MTTGQTHATAWVHDSDRAERFTRQPEITPEAVGANRHTGLVNTLFSPATRAWFEGAFDRPTDAQEGAWRAIGKGEHTLVVAPTGSGKTLAAFLSAIDGLSALPIPDEPKQR